MGANAPHSSVVRGALANPWNSSLEREANGRERKRKRRMSIREDAVIDKSYHPPVAPENGLMKAI